jgi:hypothetical protein
MCCAIRRLVGVERRNSAAGVILIIVALNALAGV